MMIGTIEPVEIMPTQQRQTDHIEIAESLSDEGNGGSLGGIIDDRLLDLDRLARSA